MNDATYCMDVLRHLAANASLDAHERLRGAEDAIKGYLPTARRNPIKRRRMLQALDNEVAIKTIAGADVFWPTVHYRATPQRIARQGLD